MEKFTSSIATVCLGTTWEQRNEKLYGKQFLCRLFEWKITSLKFLQFLLLSKLLYLYRFYDK